MRILMVNKFLYPRGGAETYFLEVGKRLESLGHSVEYYGMADKQNTVGNSSGIYAETKDFHKKSLASLMYPLSILYSKDAKRGIEKLIDGIKPDIVHLNNINYQLTPSVIEGAHSKGVPIVQTVHDTQMLCPSHMMLNLNTLELCEKCVNSSKINCIKQKCVHGSFGKSVLGAIEGSMYEHRKSYSYVGRFICPSKFMEGMLLRDKRFTGKTTALRNFIELYEPPSDKKLGYVLYFGRLSVEKGINRLMQAIRALPDVPFIVAGNGPEEEAVTRDMPKNMKFVGFQTGEALRKLICEAAFSVYLPILYENCPMSVLESEALGTPVIANRIGGIPELIENGETGILLDDFTPENYAKEIKALYDDKARLEKMRLACVNKRGSMLSLDTYVDRLLTIYAEEISKVKR